MTTCNTYYAATAEGRKIRLVKVEVGKPGTMTDCFGRTLKTSFTQTPTDEVFTTQRAAMARIVELNKGTGAISANSLD